MMPNIHDYRSQIEAALEYSGGTHEFEDVVRAVLESRMQLWPGKRSVAVTEVVKYDRKKVLHIFLAGGEMDELIDMIDSAAEWGRTQGCTSLTMAGRKGWERVLNSHGFNPVMIVLEREI